MKIPEDEPISPALQQAIDDTKADIEKAFETGKAVGTPKAPRHHETSPCAVSEKETGSRQSGSR